MQPNTIDKAAPVAISSIDQCRPRVKTGGSIAAVLGRRLHAYHSHSSAKAAKAHSAQLAAFQQLFICRIHLPTGIAAVFAGFVFCFATAT